MPVKIHGNDYVTVAERVAEFHKRYKDQTKSIITEIIQFKDGIVVVKAVVKVGEKVYVGHAYEDIGSSPIMETSSLEVCETSALGRAMGFLNIGLDVSGAIASAEEIANAINKQTAPLQYSLDSKAKKVDLSGDAWRDEPIGFKSGKNQGKSYKEVDEDTLVWIINSCKNEDWKQKAVAEMKLREKKPAKVDKEEADNLFS